MTDWVIPFIVNEEGDTNSHPQTGTALLLNEKYMKRVKHIRGEQFSAISIIYSKFPIINDPLCANFIHNFGWLKFTA